MRLVLPCPRKVALGGWGSPDEAVVALAAWDGTRGHWPKPGRLDGTGPLGAAWLTSPPASVSPAETCGWSPLGSTSVDAGVPGECHCGSRHRAVPQELAPEGSPRTRHGDAGPVSKLPVPWPGQRGSGQILRDGGKVTQQGWRKRRRGRKRRAAWAWAQLGQR